MINVVICGLDAEQNDYIAYLVSEHIQNEPVRIASFVNPEAFISYMDVRGYDMHIVISDVALGKFNGIRLMRLLQERLPDLQIVFASKYRELVFDAYAVRHVCFLPLPIDTTHFRTAMDIALENIRLRHKSYLTLARAGLISRIDLDDIVYMESSVRTLNIHLPRSVQSFTRQLESVKPLLDHRFVQCHKSYVANMDYVLSLDSTGMALLLRDGRTVPVSARKLKETRAIFESFLAQY